MSSRRSASATSSVGPVSAPRGIAALVISLRRTPDRLAAALKNLHGLGLPPSVIWASDGRDRALLESLPTAPGHRLQPGEVGLFDSWFRCAAHIVRHNLEGALVFEDDAEEVRPGVLDSLKELPANADFALLHDASVPDPILADGSTETFLAVRCCSWQTCAVYLSHSGARALLKSLPIERPIDVWLRDSGLRGFQCRPGKAFYRQTFMWPSECRENGGAGNIPLLIHQTWLGGTALPDEWARLVERWKALHPGFRHRLWTDADIAQEFKDDAETFAACKTPAAKSDFARLLILQKYGGLYADTDFEPFRCFAEILRAGSFVFGWMDAQNMANGLLASVPGGRVVNDLVAEARARIRAGRPILEAAGPGLMLDTVGPWTRAFKKPMRDGLGTAYGDTGVVGLSPQTLFPYTWTEKRPAIYPPTAWAAHHWARSWWTPEMWNGTAEQYSHTKNHA